MRSLLVGLLSVIVSLVIYSGYTTNFTTEIPLEVGVIALNRLSAAVPAL